MFGSRKSDTNILLSIYRSSRNVFRLNDIAMLTGETNFQSLSKKLNYYVSSGRLLNPRRGIYARPDFKPEEMACVIYRPSYISLEYVLQKSGIIFQYDESITAVSYLSRTIDVAGRTFRFRKIKGEILVNLEGINRLENQINIASAERAFLDLIYLDTDFYFDNLNLLNREKVYKLLPVYQTKSLSDRVKKMLNHD